MSKNIDMGMEDMPENRKDFEDLLKTANFLEKFKEDILSEFVDWDKQEMAEEIADFLENKFAALRREAGIEIFLKADKQHEKTRDLFFPTGIGEFMELSKEQFN